MGSQAVLGTPNVLGGSYDGERRTCVDATPRTEGPVRTRMLRYVGGIFQSLPVGTWVLLDLALLYVGISFGFRAFVVGRILPYLHVGMWEAWGILSASYIFASLVFLR